MREIGDIVRQYERLSEHGGTERVPPNADAPAYSLSWFNKPGYSEAYALATLVRAQGSSYRRPGARMMVAADGSAVGSLSGGCLEEEVIAHTREVLRTGMPAWMEFDTRRRFGCHGTLEIFIERAEPGFFAKLADCYHARRSAVLATRFARDGVETGTRFVEGQDDAAPETFVQRIVPPVQLLVIGDGPDSGALHSFGETLGWSVIQLDSATELRGGYDEWTAAIVKTHNYGRDCAALRALLSLGLRYIGLLGPRRRRDRLVGDILDSGVEVNGSVFGPAGLDLGGDAPETIALAIVAEIQAVFTGGSGQSLRNRRAPIHAPLVRDVALPF